MPTRDPIRALASGAVPDGLLWLESAGLAHPEAARAAALPFVFEVGRLANLAGAPGRRHTVREAELVVASLPPRARDGAQAAGLLEGYARFVVATNPTRHARLTGRALAAYLAAEIASGERA